MFQSSRYPAGAIGIAVLALLLSTSSTLAQQPQQGGGNGNANGGGGGNAQTGSQAQREAAEAPALVVGRVVRIGTGEPVAGAEVTLRRDQGRGQQLAAVTDAAGRFLIGNISAGDYRLEVESEGFVDREYGQVSPSRPGTIISLAPGQQMNDIVVNMVPTGVITGRVFDQNGRPLEGVEVRALRFEYDDGVRVLDDVQEAETNDLGNYRLYWLEPGEYFVSATFNSNRQQLQQLAEAISNAIPEDLQQLRQGGLTSGGTSPLEFLIPQIREAQGQTVAAEIYVDTYFPGTYDASKASSVSVLPATEMGSINFTVLPTRAVTVSGRVVGPFSESDNLTTSVTLVPRNSLMATTGGGRGNGRGGGRGQDGSFSISGVAPGSYTLVATMETRGRGRNGGDVQLSGFANVEVGQQDVENIAVQVQPAVTIRGQIWIETETAGDLDLDDLRVRLQPPRDIPLGSPNADVEDDGTFEIEEVGQTLYRASLSGLPNDHYVVQARAGAYEALGNGIYVTSGMPPLEFWVSGAGATLEGTVNAGSGQVFTGAQVVLVPQDMRRQDLFKVAAPDQYGRFSMSGIAPGRYNVYAWEDLPSGAYLDPIFVNQYRDRAFALDVQKGVQTTARPHLIPATRPYR